ncbi:Hypothetical protein NCS54_01295800 [Fusarium falciforme]|uniref:Hypothetical protein n=1 Tax=Fusarium falciforme TaxID=195108 RepID=UPI00230130BD|nr:Hypothetical protein NCS54_01295800 [Fusarium falciforme]WAO95342.1 Hypothetical protein NCS54_01295800 [Fusarium falciforme]
MRSLSYQSLQDFTGLQAVREAVASGDPGILVLDLPLLQGDASLKTLPHGLVLQKHGAPSSASVTVMEKLHKFSHVIFKNLSHAVELPWEKYLGEMHEFTAPGNDELRTVSLDEPLANEWSTLTIVLNASHPQQALVLFGAALATFTEGMTSKSPGPAIDVGELAGLIGKPEGDWIVYYVRPNEDVFYTRTAGALMTPLSTIEYQQRKRIKDTKIV